MRRTAIIIMAVGFLFVHTEIWMLGIDLTIDAVGYLVVWNGLRALQKTEKVFGFGTIVTLALVVITAAQLFVPAGLAALLAALLRAVCEGLLHWQILWGFATLARQEGRRADRIMALVVLCLTLLLAVYQMALLVPYTFTQACPALPWGTWPQPVASLVGWAFTLCMAWFAFSFGKPPTAGDKSKSEPPR